MSCCADSTAVCTITVYAQPVQQIIVTACLPPVDAMVLGSLVIMPAIDSPTISTDFVEWDFTADNLVSDTAIPALTGGLAAVDFGLDGVEADSEVGSITLNLQQYFMLDGIVSETAVRRVLLGGTRQFNLGMLSSDTAIEALDLTITKFVSQLDGIVCDTAIESIDLLLGGTLQPSVMPSHVVIAQPDLTTTELFTIGAPVSDTVISEPAFVISAIKGVLFDNGEGAIFDVDVGEAFLIIGTGDAQLWVGTGDDSLIIGTGGEGNAGWISDGELT